MPPLLPEAPTPTMPVVEAAPEAPVEADVPEAPVEAAAPDALLAATAPEAAPVARAPEVPLEARAPEAPLDAGEPDALDDRVVPEALVTPGEPLGPLVVVPVAPLQADRINASAPRRIGCEIIAFPLLGRRASLHEKPTRSA